LDQSIDIDSKDKNGRTPLHIAFCLGSKDVVEKLISSRADIDDLDNNHMIPLHLVSFWDQDIVVET